MRNNNNYLRIVLVEKEESSLGKIEKEIPWESLGFEFSGKTIGGAMGEKLIACCKPDVVISELELKDESAFDLFDHIKVKNLILLSEVLDYSNVRKALQYGVLDYLKKPINQNDLINSLMKVKGKLLQEVQCDEICPIPEKASNFLINQAIGFIKDNYSKPISLADLSLYTRTSENHLSTLFKEVLGINFLQYLNSYRLNRAAKYLRETNYNISEVAEKCGFPTPSYFTKLFKRYTSMTPKEYRDKL